MKRSAKLAVTAILCVAAIAVVLVVIVARNSGSDSLKGWLQPSAPAQSTSPDIASAKLAAPADNTIPKTFVLAKDSLSEYGEVKFDHDAHAFKPYSPDGKSVMGCVECHHTDQPKSALKPPLATSERDVTLTMEVFQKASQKVSECRACHFQDGNVPEGKTMPTSAKKDLNNELAFHINCNTCHDAAFKLRPELKSRPGFATSKDCTVCHKAS